MSNCTWVALLEDNETGRLSQRYFRYFAFAEEEEALKDLQEELSPSYTVLEVSTNPYKYKNMVW